MPTAQCASRRTSRYRGYPQIAASLARIGRTRAPTACMRLSSTVMFRSMMSGSHGGIALVCGVPRVSLSTPTPRAQTLFSSNRPLENICERLLVLLSNLYQLHWCVNVPNHKTAVNWGNVQGPFLRASSYDVNRSAVSLSCRIRSPAKSP
jgi:hypothetical protein